MSNTELETYFEDLATRFRLIGHTLEEPRYCRFNIDEVVTGLRHKLALDHFSLLLEAPSGNLEDNGSDGFFDNQEIAFMIVRTVEIRNFEEERDTISESRELGIKLLGKILEEKKFADLDESGIEYEKVGPVFGNCFGYRYTLPVIDTVSFAVDPNDWL